MTGPVLRVIEGLQCDCINMRAQSPLAWFMFQSSLTGVITPEWDLNPRQAGRQALRKQDLYYGEGGKLKLKCIFGLQYDGHDKQELFLCKGQGGELL